MDHLQRNGLLIPMLFRAVLGLRLECTMVDVLHTVDLGLTAHVCGNIIWWLVIICNIYNLSTYAQRMQAVQNDYKAWCKRTRCKNRLRGPITVERVRPDAADSPQFKSKAAPLRGLTRYVLYLMQTYGQFDSANPWIVRHDTLALGVIRLLTRFYEILESESQFLSESARNEMPTLGEQLMQFYSQLADMCYKDQARLGHVLWKTSPKMHLFLHLCIWQCVLYGNPTHYWTYGDEDLVGRLVSIAEGVHSVTLAVSVLANWLHVVWDDVLLEDSDAEE